LPDGLTAPHSRNEKEGEPVARPLAAQDATDSQLAATRGRLLPR